MEWAKSKEEPLGEADLHELETIHDDSTVLAVSKQVYTVLASLTDGEALSMVMNVLGRNGLESWRRLNRRFDPQTAGRRKNAMQEILAAKPVSLKELPATIEKWEARIRHYEESPGRPL